MQQPIVILQSYVDSMSRAVMADDFASYAAGIVLPFQLETAVASLRVATEDALLEIFETFADTLRSQNVTDLIRLAKTAQFHPNGEIHGQYETHILARALRIVQPFTSHITLAYVAGRWRTSFITNTLLNARFPILLPKPSRSQPAV